MKKEEVYYAGRDEREKKTKGRNGGRKVDPNEMELMEERERCILRGKR